MGYSEDQVRGLVAGDRSVVEGMVSWLAEQGDELPFHQQVWAMNQGCPDFTAAEMQGLLCVAIAMLAEGKKP